MDCQASYVIYAFTCLVDAANNMLERPFTFISVTPSPNNFMFTVVFKQKCSANPSGKKIGYFRD